MKLARYALAAMAATGALVMTGNISMAPGDGWISKAEARVGRPATPVSYAGVARRTTRRAVGATAAACVTRYNAYGQPYTVC